MDCKPKLRFPEFSGEWEEKKLGDICDNKSSKYNPEKEDTNFRCVELEHLSQETGQLLGYCDSKEQNSIKNKFKSENVLFGKLRPYLKKYWFTTFEGVCSTEIWVFNGKEVTNEFLYQMIQTNKFDYIANISSGSKMPRSDWNYMRNVNFNIPSVPEQQKIASFLSKVDEKIEKLEKKKELWENYKKGMMQQIFSQKLRFKDENGEDYPDWINKRLNEIIKLSSSNLAMNNLEKNTGSYKLYGASGFIKHIDFYEKDERYIAIVKDGSGVGNTFLGDPKTSVLGTMQYLTTDTQNDLIFIYYLFSTISFKKYIIGSSIPHIYFKDYSKELVEIPTLSEQEKIANFILVIDNKINIINKELEVNQNYKKGLLQQMFF